MADYNTIEQRIDAAGQWNGTTPPGATPTPAGGILTWPAGPTGGLFDFEFSTTFWTWTLTHLEVNFGSIVNKGVYIHERDAAVPGAHDIPVWESADVTETHLLITPPDQIILNANQVLVITSDACAAEMFARVTAQPGLSIPAHLES